MNNIDLNKKACVLWLEALNGKYSNHEVFLPKEEVLDKNLIVGSVEKNTTIRSMVALLQAIMIQIELIERAENGLYQKTKRGQFLLDRLYKMYASVHILNVVFLKEEFPQLKGNPYIVDGWKVLDDEDCPCPICKSKKIKDSFNRNSSNKDSSENSSHKACMNVVAHKIFSRN